MCNKDFGCLNQSLLHSDNTVDYQLDGDQAVYLMDSPSANVPGLDSTHGSNEDVPRVKFLCSFLGSILPRPQDGKLRYVGGETRIVSLPRDVTYEELMSRMRELYEGAVVLKYQQPDEDLDALVSVVNDDDVTNMMEEYEKLGSGDGFTRLRIFLFSHLDQDGSNHYVDGDERESERRYVDALNSMNDGNDFSQLQHQESPMISSIDDVYMAERFLNTMNLDGGIHNLPQYNVHHLTVPHMSSGQHQQPVSQRYNEMEGPWSPSYYSPRHYWHHDPPRPLPEFPSSPPSARFRMPFGEERIPEEYVRQHVNHHPTYEPQPQFSEKLAWMPPGTVSGDKNGFPGNLFHGLNVFDGNGVCEHCRLNYRRNQLHLDQSNMGNGLPHIPISCAECRPNRENLILNAEAKLAHGMYPKDNDSRSVYNESHSHERGWFLQHQLNPRVEEARTFMSGAGRLTDHYLVDGPSMNIPPGHSNLVDGHHMSPKHVHHRAGPEMGNELFHDAAAAAAPHLHIPSPEEHVVRYGNYPYGADSIYPVSHGHAPAQTLWRNVQNPMHGAPSYEASSSLVNGSINAAYIRGAVEGNSRFLVGVDNQNSWVEPSQRLPGFEGTATPPEYYYSQVQRLNLQSHNQENQLPDLMKQSDSLSALIHDKLVSSTACCSPGSRNNNVSEAGRMDGNCNLGQEKEASRVENVEITDVKTTCPEQNMTAKKSMGSSSFQTFEVSGDIEKSGEIGPSASPEDMQLSAHSLSFLPELIASVKRAALEGAEEVKAKVEENNDSVKRDTMPKEAPASESELASIHGELEIDSDNDNVKNSEIEPTMAEAEAISRGLQTIKNDDLEEIRELGSGTYGSVYYGKWRGSDVAIKRIKASCFAGRPSERERLIADFWKEASLLSSLHHPNVVSFYGIVRDGPDGSLATVTEFMVNGSLKQFFQKKDRTIDRRKRLIIAMDAAFGMEYLHGKNIVHFDLKCENLLVNMRDPQRPVCKIGDLGLSKVKQQTLVSGGVRGTIPWMAPELLSGKSHMVTEKIDVYSFGIVMWELLTGDEPYAEMHCASIIGGIVNHTLRPQIPTWCDPEWKSLMESCWASDPSERPSFSEISQRLRSMAAAINVK